VGFPTSGIQERWAPLLGVMGYLSEVLHVDLLAADRAGNEIREPCRDVEGGTGKVSAGCHR
jgi:hypothetical protein